MKKKVSIIIPVYNMEQYLDECLKSILEQTYSNLEIILINDGSTDDSLNICKSYSQLDERICVYTKLNGGVSETRNLGIEKANGDYIMFVDSDDYIENSMVETLVDLMTDDVKMSACTYKFIGEDINGKNTKGISFKLYNSKEDYLDILQKNWAPFCKLIKKELTTKVRFDKNVAIAEDLQYNVDIICENDDFKVAYINEPLYCYRLSDNSATRRKYNSKFLVGLNVEEIVYNKIKEKMTCKNLYRILVNGVFVFYSRYAKLDKYEKIEFLNDYNSSRDIIKKNKYYLIKMKGKNIREFFVMLLIVFFPRLYFCLNR